MHIANLERQLNGRQRDATAAARDYADVANERRAIANERSTLTQAYAKLEAKCTTAEKKCAGLEDQCTRLKYKCGGIEYKCAALENKCTRLEKKCTGLESKCQTLGRERDVAYTRLTSLESQHVRCAETIATQRVELEKLRVAPKNPPGGPWAALVSVQTENARLRSLLPGVSSAGTLPRRSRDGITKRKFRDQSEDELQSEPGSPTAIERLETADKELETLTSTNKKLKAEQEFWVVRARGVEVANGGLGEECARLQAENTRLAAENAALLSGIAKSQERRDQRVDGQEPPADLRADNLTVWQRDGFVAANGGVVDDEQVQVVPNAEEGEIVGEKRKQKEVGDILFNNILLLRADSFTTAARNSNGPISRARAPAFLPATADVLSYNLAFAYHLQRIVRRTHKSPVSFHARRAAGVAALVLTSPARQASGSAPGMPCPFAMDSPQYAPVVAAASYHRAEPVGVVADTTNAKPVAAAAARTELP
jgi:predicted nuclease with TOPRIM domain